MPFCEPVPTCRAQRPVPFFHTTDPPQPPFCSDYVLTPSFPTHAGPRGRAPFLFEARQRTSRRKSRHTDLPLADRLWIRCGGIGQHVSALGTNGMTKVDVAA